MEQIKGAPTICSRCGAYLCIRKQTLNLALGNIESLFCLACLADNERESPESLLLGTVGYIMSRDCFKKEWLRYAGIEDCPEPRTCVPETCFNEKLGS